MNVLVFNCGSSSLKYKLLKMPEQLELAGGEAQRVGPVTSQPACIIHRVNGQSTSREIPMPNHAVAFKEVMTLLRQTPDFEPDVVGHRMAHGGTVWKHHTRVNTETLEHLQETKQLAPLHNPPAISLVEACSNQYPALPQILIFDTAYHSSIPEYAKTYALPRFMREDLGIRKYGFHGTSHRYVAQETARLMGIDFKTFNAVSCHLGSGGASLCAIVCGKSLDNTMGHSPLQGLIMSTRSGDLDATVVMRMLRHQEGNSQSVTKLLNTQSGVLGMSGYTADIRDVVKSLSQPTSDASLSHALDMYTWRTKKYLGSYLLAVAAHAGKPADAIILTDTIGETMPSIRWQLCVDIQCFGVTVDRDLNQTAAPLPHMIATADSPIKVWVIQTNEELAIANHAYALMAKPSNPAKEGAL